MLLLAKDQGLFVCSKEEHSYFRRKYLDDSIGCAFCTGTRLLSGFNDFETMEPVLAKEWSSKNTHKAAQTHFNSKKLTYFNCPQYDHEYGPIRLNTRKDYKNGCTICSGRQVLKGFNDFETLFPDLAYEWAEINEKQPSDYRPYSNQRVFWDCFKCQHSWIASINKRARGSNCPNCFKKSRTSKGEKELATFIESLGFKTVKNDRTLLSGKEIDVYLPELKIGFEYNGDYWHSEKFRPRNYSQKEIVLEKMARARKSGIKLFLILEKEWKKENCLVKSLLERFLHEEVNYIKDKNLNHVKEK